MPHRRQLDGLVRGVTLIEVVVVIAVIGLLIALLMPALQSARATARRLQCHHNLRQLGLAMQHYHVAHRSFPYGVNGGWGHSWSAHILPYVEQTDLAETIPWSDRGWWRGTDANSLALQKLAQTRISFFRCPAQAGPETWSVNQLDDRFVTNYLACAGGDARHDNHGPGGMSESNGIVVAADFLGYTRPPRRLRDVRDGTSNTLLLSEAVFMLDADEGCFVCDRFYLYHPNADTLAGSDFSEALGSTYYPLNTRSHREIARECAFSSAHFDGVVGALADGSTGFFDSSISLTVWRNLGSIRDEPTW